MPPVQFSRVIASAREYSSVFTDQKLETKVPTVQIIDVELARMNAKLLGEPGRRAWRGRSQ
jgi:hypothetical protein